MQASGSVSSGVRWAALSHGEHSPPPCSSVLRGGSVDRGPSRRDYSCSWQLLKKQPQPAPKATGAAGRARGSRRKRPVVSSFSV